MNLITSWDAESVSAPHGFLRSRMGSRCGQSCLSTGFTFPSELMQSRRRAVRKLGCLEKVADPRGMPTLPERQGLGQNVGPHALQTHVTLVTCDISHGKRDLRMELR